MQRIVPFLWFDGQAEEAATLYTSLFPDSRIDTVNRMSDGDATTTTVVEFTLAGQRWRAMNGGPGHPHNDAVSFQVDVDDQQELDRYWDALTDGGEEVACGWLRDRWGVAWQITPTRMSELLSDPDPERAARTMTAMMDMVKLDIAALEAAADGR
ncbi:VOC family protein [Curtobacterium sp. Leaf261]|uniref:VOC family protein n=1 Tax=Curtobacterium sp. Leaf261 TaxID=1736311 RepID=UPI0006F8FC8B|nr:VOC family protein [Curtobacterium sp. Leaf261]KQO65106.1 3-demethylubiquinone-9 3-methyltransferase [Curtobacterium sp. Leaf261]